MIQLVAEPLCQFPFAGEHKGLAPFIEGRHRHLLGPDGFAIPAGQAEAPFNTLLGACLLYTSVCKGASGGSLRRFPSRFYGGERRHQQFGYGLHPDHPLYGSGRTASHGRAHRPPRGIIAVTGRKLPASMAPGVFTLLVPYKTGETGFPSSSMPRSCSQVIRQRGRWYGPFHMEPFWVWETVPSRCR